MKRLKIILSIVPIFTGICMALIFAPILYFWTLDFTEEMNTDLLAESKFLETKAEESKNPDKERYEIIARDLKTQVEMNNSLLCETAKDIFFSGVSLALLGLVFFLFVRLKEIEGSIRDRRISGSN